MRTLIEHLTAFFTETVTSSLNFEEAYEAMIQSFPDDSEKSRHIANDFSACVMKNF
jgi:hypothetical protein